MIEPTYLRLSGQSSKGRVSRSGSTVMGLDEPLLELVLDIEGGVTSIM